MSAISHRIRELRKARGLTLEQVGTMVGVGKSTVRKWETGAIANMRSDKISSLAAALGTTPSYLMGWQEDQDDTRHIDLPPNILPLPNMHSLLRIRHTGMSGTDVSLMYEEEPIMVPDNVTADCVFVCSEDHIDGSRFRSGDIFYLDRTSRPSDGDLVLAIMDNTYLIRRITHTSEALVFSSDATPPIVKIGDSPPDIQILGRIVGGSLSFS